ncbi:MAG: hypothetical protein M1821_006871 [Bathelium mastoideum]|nr:MAG: hypothetical protein M1821_006871 [Bathelium mastoideum]KAI9676313.1 MAG: hypothetical protein M1822_008347 [Bathelium mastoideum]
METKTINWKEEGIDRRLLAAVYAAMDDAKAQAVYSAGALPESPNVKQIAKYFARGATESAIDNQIKKIKAEAEKLKEESVDDVEPPAEDSAPKKSKKANQKIAAVVKSEEVGELEEDEQAFF